MIEELDHRIIESSDHRIIESLNRCGFAEAAIGNRQLAIGNRK